MDRKEHINLQWWVNVGMGLIALRQEYLGDGLENAIGGFLDAPSHLPIGSHTSPGMRHGKDMIFFRR